LISQLPDQERERERQRQRERGKASERKSDLTGARKGKRERQKIIYIKLCGARWEMISGTLILKLLPIGAATPEHQTEH